MKSIRPTLLFAALVAALSPWLHAGCEGSTGPDSFTALHVDPIIGVDEKGRGASDRPFRTITYALDQVNPDANNEIALEPGTYDQTSGETFPVIVRIPVKVRSSGPAQIRGSGDYFSATVAAVQSAAVVFDSCTGCGLAGQEGSLSVVDTSGGTSVWVEQSEVSLEGLTLENGGSGVVFAGGAGGGIARSKIMNNSMAGIVVAHAASPKIRRCQIQNNATGIEIVFGAIPDIGTDADYGRNTIRGNTVVDLCNRTDNLINALGNEWDEDPFLFVIGGCDSGNNIGNTGSASVRYQLLPTDALLFPQAKPIELLAPAIGALTGDLEPTLTWVPNGEGLEFAAIFLRPPAQTGNKVSNKGDVVWAWHSKLGTGSHDSAAFQDGVAVIAGELTSTAPAPLLPGRAYYWAVWAWDDEGREIASSSRTGYFITTN